jgi:uracil-DNA glycosylase
MQQETNKTILDLLYWYKIFGYEYVHINYPSKKDNLSVDLPNDLKELEEYVYHCHLCPLSSRNKKLKFGVGNPNSQIYIIGTSKYQNTDVFDLFRDMFFDILGLDQDSYYLLDILKCDTNGYKIDTLQSRQICINFLIKQIELSDVKLIVVIGEEFEYNKVKVINLFDFEYLYKNPTLKTKMIADMQQIKNIMENIK